jgi:hypothetical protein
MYMKQNQYNFIAAGMVTIAVTLAACNNNRENSTDRTSNDAPKDTSLTDTRRNSSDTVNYLTKDSGNKSQETIDPNPPQNSRY